MTNSTSKPFIVNSAKEFHFPCVAMCCCKSSYKWCPISCTYIQVEILQISVPSQLEHRNIQHWALFRSPLDTYHPYYGVALDHWAGGILVLSSQSQSVMVFWGLWHTSAPNRPFITPWTDQSMDWPFNNGNNWCTIFPINIYLPTTSRIYSRITVRF